MKRTLNLILSKTCQINKFLILNWIIYSISLFVFQTLWVLLPEKICNSILVTDKRGLLFGSLLGLLAAFALFLSTWLSNAGWMRMQRVRYSVLLDLIKASIRIPFSKSINSEFLSRLEKAREASMNPSIGIGSMMNEIYQLPAAILTSIGMFGIISRMSALLGIFLLVTVFISFRITVLIEKKDEEEWQETTPLSRNHEKVYDLLMEECYAKDIRIFSLKNLLHSYGKNYSAIIHGIMIKKQKEKWNYQMFLLITEFLRDVVVYVWLATGIVSGHLPIGSFLTYVLGVLQLGNAIQSIFYSNTKIQKEAKRFSDYWKIIDEIEQSEKPVYLDTKFEDMSSQPLSLEFDHVTFSYPDSDKPTIHDLSFVILPGKRTAIIGMNGAGKSTIIKLICRLYEPQFGCIKLNGVDIKKIPLEQYYQQLSVVLQTGNIFPFSIYDNVSLSEDTDLERYCKAMQLSGFYATEDKLPKKGNTVISNIMNSEGVNISGGESQKLLLARAIYRNGRIFLLDEPAGAIDAIAEEELYHNYSEITKNSTSIIVSHQLSFIGFCDWIILLEKGRIIENGTHIQLMELKGQYYEMYIGQKKRYEEV